ncbi:protein phosphatase 2C domain-containing protein [Paenibacillus lignilyticus]|uniref:Protein phosphatase 2C domain-containing protein n=1 Tax=Paenibacillus lignilyticus TaxID=1172615 RepID=A0ABS5CG00_9BACL|nr:protein phosphatase 2C domain-containing protein [Paenibacillus lignilyticus]MBP3964789.1 protein phosphatase 2C domain-containing protein [Paenibacillus lignilyticus]
MELTSVSVKGVSPWNEDAIIRNEDLRLLGVIDGATSLVPYKGPGGESGGYLAAQLVARTCNEATAAEGNSDLLMSLLSRANTALRAAMVDAGISPEKKEAVWNACAALVRVQPKWIDFAQLGDCMLAVYYTDGTIRIVTNDQLAHVDDRTKAVWAQGVAEGLTTREALWEYSKPVIIAGREVANTLGGYGVINGDPTFGDYAEFGRISRTNVKSLLLFTDGLYIPKPPGEPDKDSAVEIASLVREMGLPRYIEWLTELEESDPDCTRFPRVKKSDDKTALWIDL